jgi:hypothetical protein
MNVNHNIPTVEQRKSHRIDYIKVLVILDLVGDKLMDNRLTINLAFRQCGQNSRIYLRRPLLIQRNRNRRRSLLDDNQFRLRRSIQSD